MNVVIELSRRDAGRLRECAKTKLRGFQKGLEKFGDDFDPEKGKNIREGHDAYTNLVQTLDKALNDDNPNPRGAGRHSQEPA